MSYREINLRASDPDAASTEIMYEIAAGRADSVDLIRFNISLPDASADEKRLFFHAIRLLKNMKQKGTVHFLATREDFSISSTEAVFLQNKYPELFDSLPMENDGSLYIYVKI